MRRPGDFRRPRRRSRPGVRHGSSLGRAGQSTKAGPLRRKGSALSAQTEPQPEMSGCLSCCGCQKANVGFGKTARGFAPFRKSAAQAAEVAALRLKELVRSHAIYIVVAVGSNFGRLYAHGNQVRRPSSQLTKQ